MEVIVKAEVRRLFHALSAPEYIETWLCLPGHLNGCQNIATRVEDDFIIAHHCDGIPTIQISGTYSLCERRNLSYSWRVSGDRSASTSQVAIRLSGYFEYTTLQLRHTGLASRENYVWHQSLWSLSLARLKGLYSPSPGMRDKAFSHLQHGSGDYARRRTRDLGAM